MKAENKNFIYNVIYQIFIYIVPLITTPYISRVLGVENIGTYSYTYSIVYYFMLATMLGINNYGSRTIAIEKSEGKDISYKFCSIYYLQLFLGILMLIIYNIVIFLFFSEYRVISLIHNLFLISSILDINWLFFGLERFKLTISRSILIKIVSMLLIFILVKNENDLFKYTLIMSGSTLISQLYLWIFAKKIIKFKKIKIKDIIYNFKKCIVLFIPVISYSIYRVMDKTMLGSLSGTTALGYYENAEKIINIPVSFLSALGTIMIPSMSKTRRKDEFMSKIYQSFELCFCFIIPMFFGLLAIGKNFSVIFFGEDFVESGIIIRLLTPTIICTAIANVIRTNYLIPKEKDKIYVKSTIFGAIVNFIVNLILIPKLSYYGAAIGTILAEFLVMLYQIIKTRDTIDFRYVLKIFGKYLIKGFIMFCIIMLLDLLIDNLIVKLIAQISVAFVIYFIMNRRYIIEDFLGKKTANSMT